MKVIDTTLFQPVVIGGKKERWFFKCDFCNYLAIFILWKGSGMSTGCEKCPGSMERCYKIRDEVMEKIAFGETLFGKKKFDERMKNVLSIKFKGEKYLLVGDFVSGGAITTQDNYDNFKISYAHLYPDGKIRRYDEVIGTKDDIEVLKR